MTVSFTSAQLEFRTEDPINSYSDFNFNQNTITNLTVPNNPQGGEAITQRHLASNYLQRDGGQLEGTLYANGEDLVGVGELELEGGTNITGNLNVSEGAEINDNLNINRGADALSLNGTSTDHAFQEWYVDSNNPDQRSAWLGYGTGANKDFTINNQYGNKIRLKGGSVEIPNGKLNLANNRLTDIGSSGTNFRASGTLDLEGESISNINQIISSEDGLARVQFGTGVDLEVGDGSGTSINALQVENGGNVKIPNGVLDLDNNAIQNADWSNANDLNNGGGINDFSNANDLDNSGNIVSDSVGEGEIAENAVGNQEINNSENIDVSTLDVSGSINGSDWSSLDISSSDINADDVGTAGGIRSDSGDIALDANDLDSTGEISDFSNANDLNRAGDIADFSAANDLDSTGDVISNSIGNNEIDNSGKIDLSNGKLVVPTGDVY